MFDIKVDCISELKEEPKNYHTYSAQLEEKIFISKHYVPHKSHYCNVPTKSPHFVYDLILVQYL